MEGEPERETMREASAEVSREFKTLIDHRDVDSLKQLQQLMYLSLSLNLLFTLMFASIAGSRSSVLSVLYDLRFRAIFSPVALT